MRHHFLALLTALLALPAYNRPVAAPAAEAASSEPEPAAGSVIRVTASYPGASAHVVADTVAAPLVQQFDGVEGATRIEAETRNDGTCTITVRFGPRTDINVALVLVQMRISVAEPQLPEEVRRRGLTTRKLPDGPPAFWLALTGGPDGTDARDLANFARVYVQKELEQLKGTAEVRVIPDRGGYTLKVWLDPDKLAARKLTAPDVVDALKLSGIQVVRRAVGQPPGPAGQAQQFALTVNGRLTDQKSLGRLIVKATPDGTVTRLRDLGRIEIEGGGGRFAPRVSGKPAALIAVTAWPGQLTAARIREVVAKIEKLSPEGVRLDLAADRTADRLVVVEVQLPGEASLERTEKVAGRASGLIRGLPGKPGCVEFGDDHEPNRATLLVKLPAKDGPTAADIRKALAEIREAVCRVSELSAGREPFPVRIALTDPGNQGEEEFQKLADAVVRKINEAGAATDVGAFPGRPIPQLHVTFDRAKLTALGVPQKDAVEAVRVATGGTVNNLGRFGRGLVVEVAGAGRTRAEDLGQLKVRNEKGEMVPLKAVAEFRAVEAAPAVLLLNGHRAIILTANPPPSKTAAAAAACLKIARAELPVTYKAEDLTTEKPR